jgi:GWxTD domain-containing protein
MNFHKHCFVFVFILLAYTLAFSQPMRDEIRQPMLGMAMPVTFETFSTWTSDTTAAQVQILYRINGGFFFFAKGSNTAKEEYTAQAEVIVEILDTLNNTVTRKIQPVQVLRSSLPNETDKPNDIQGSLAFTLKTGTYHVLFEAKDSESGKSITNHDTRITIPRVKKDSVNISSPLLVECLRNDSLAFVHPVFIPVNRGESIAFGTTSAYVLQLLAIDSLSNFKLHWNIIGHPENDQDKEQRWSDSTFRVFNGIPQVTAEKNKICYTVLDSNVSSKIVYFSIPFEKIPEGRYRFLLSLQGNMIHLEREWNINVVWKNKPRSLMNLDIAINALRHIATEDELSQMRGFLSSNNTQRFYEFWKKKNSDTTRAYNPVMAEYYRRVDETIQKYSTSKEEDGYRTDRGRILILFGHPSRTDRSLKPSSVPTEVWTYEKLRKYFIFTDKNRNNNYELTQAETY